MWIVELDTKCWLATGSGDPARTLSIENARNFKTEQEANRALKRAKRYFPRRGYMRSKVVYNAELTSPPDTEPKRSEEL